MKRKSTTEKLLERFYQEAFKRNCSNVQFNIMDLSKVESETIATVTAGGDYSSVAAWDNAIQAARDKYRQN